MSIKPLFTATATSIGGRNGHSEAQDHSVAVDLSVPKAMGGPGKPGTTTPEHLFAAGYAACFGGALRVFLLLRGDVVERTCWWLWTCCQAPCQG